MLEKAVSNFVTKRVEIVGQEIEEKLVSQTTTQRGREAQCQSILRAEQVFLCACVDM
jgi:hypothetical protein